MVRVRLFAGLQEFAKHGEIQLHWRDGMTVGQVRSAIIRETPTIEPLLTRSKAAVGEELAEDHMEVPDAAEVSFLPPVSGG
jgi:molybdopterin converting factor small subunit